MCTSNGNRNGNRDGRNLSQNFSKASAKSIILHENTIVEEIEEIYSDSNEHKISIAQNQINAIGSNNSNSHIQQSNDSDFKSNSIVFAIHEANKNKVFEDSFQSPAASPSYRFVRGLKYYGNRIRKKSHISWGANSSSREPSVAKIENQQE